jgi:hypothetical protein
MSTQIYTEKTNSPNPLQATDSQLYGWVIWRKGGPAAEVDELHKHCHSTVIQKTRSLYNSSVFPKELRDAFDEAVDRAQDKERLDAIMKAVEKSKAEAAADLMVAKQIQDLRNQLKACQDREQRGLLLIAFES